MDLTKWSTPNTYDTNFSCVPGEPGVYLIVWPQVNHESKSLDDEILYVGSSKNLIKRYERHEVIRLLRNMYGYVQFYFRVTADYKKEEIDLIKKIKPRFNTQHNG